MAGENSKSWVRVPIQYPTASCYSMSLDVALYSHEPNRIGEKRTRLTVRPRHRRGPAFHAAALDPDDQADDQHHGTRLPGPTHRNPLPLRRELGRTLADPVSANWKCRRRATVSWVRIPPSPPVIEIGVRRASRRVRGAVLD